MGMRVAAMAMTVALAVALALFSGCVERALVITSEPSGADITVNQQWKGKTPFVLPFKHYGVYDIWIEHPGIEEDGKKITFYPLHVGEPVTAPGYQYAGADFVTEVLLPKTLYDQRNLHYVLERVGHADDVSDVLDRAEQLRMASRRRSEMRYDKDVQRGRYGEEPPAAPDAGTTNPDAPVYYDDHGIDATPPSPYEVPVFLP